MSGAKTEEPTAARIRRARAEGDHGASVYASQALAFVVAAALLPATVAAVAARFEGRLRDAIRQAALPDASVVVDAGGLARDVAILVVPVLLGVALATTVGSLLQAGGIATARTARADRASPFARLGEAVSRARLFAVARALTGGVLVIGIVARELRAHAADIARTSGRLGFVAPVAAAMTRSVTWKIAFAALALGAIDLAVTRTLWRGRLRMSRDQIRRERREAEGDPLTREAREQSREEAIRQGALTEVQRARIVVHDGGRVACALRYDEGDRAPVVLATGENEASDAIVRRARREQVPVREDAVVAQALRYATAGEQIPEELYDAVAELLRELSELPA